MSWRARDILPLTVGTYLAVLGVFFLIDTLGWRHIGAAGMAGVGFGPLWSLRTSLAVWCTAAVVFPILTFRFSRGVWTAIVHLTGGVY